MSKSTRQRFSAEFKREAVRLLEQGDKDTSQLARELGVRRNQLYKWKEEIDNYAEAAFPGKGRRSKTKDNGNTSFLQAENKRLKEENEILKKASIFFARECK